MNNSNFVDMVTSLLLPAVVVLKNALIIFCTINANIFILFIMERVVTVILRKEPPFSPLVPL